MAKDFPTRKEDYSGWYQAIIKNAQLAEHSPVRGCMIIKPYGYALWENIKAIMDKKFKETGHVNAYFPLFIPKSYLSKEAKHVEGFAKECAVVTHYRLKTNEAGDGVVVDPEAKLDEELIVRPTSETIIWDTYRKWIQSYRDLPILVNQWANVVRWEMRTRFFLRTAEFLWQEGHTAHATRDEALHEAQKMLDVYTDVIENYMAIPVVKGEKTESERFAGADITYTTEVLVQDGKALQAGTSHLLGQNFSKAFDVKFATKDGGLDYVWGTSWGTTTRLIGALIMAHSDDKGLIIPPRIAPFQVIIIPIDHGEVNRADILEAAKKLQDQLKSAGISVRLDDSDAHQAGWKFTDAELKGIPVRLTLGPRDLKKGTVELVRRDLGEKKYVKLENIEKIVQEELEEMHHALYNKAKSFNQTYTTRVDTYDEMKEVLATKKGFVLAHWDGTPETEALIKEETKATIRCIPLDQLEEEGKCVYSGKPSKRRVLFAEAY